MTSDMSLTLGNKNLEWDVREAPEVGVLGA